MPRPLEALIHLDALHHNLQRARECAPDARVWSVVKANAYGHGLTRVFEGLRATDGFALLDIAEAKKLRDLDWRGPILLLEGVLMPEIWSGAPASVCGMWCIATNKLTGSPSTKPNGPTCVLKMNTGMNRLGFKTTGISQRLGPPERPAASG